MIYREAIRNGWTERNPARLVQARKEDNGRIRFLSDEEEKAIRLIIAEEYPERFLNEFEIALHTGMRRSEQFSLAWNQVDFKGKRIQLLKTKNGTGRAIPLNSAALVAFERQFQVSGHTESGFIADDGKPLIRKPILRWFEETMLKAQIRDFSWHCLRHTFASRLVMAGVALKAVQELMGHKTIQMTARYAHLSPDHLQSAVELISGAKPAQQPLETRTATRTATSATRPPGRGSR
jgi:site-specific recombinase XerD